MLNFFNSYTEIGNFNFPLNALSKLVLVFFFLGV